MFYHITLSVIIIMNKEYTEIYEYSGFEGLESSIETVEVFDTLRKSSNATS